MPSNVTGETDFEGILWVTAEPPDRSGGGGSIRQAHLFESLASNFPTELLVVGSLDDPRVRASAAGVTELPRGQALWTSNPVGRRAVELALTFGSPYPSAAYPSRPWRRELARALVTRLDQYRLVCVEHEWLAPLVPPSSAVRRIITFHHLLSDMAGQQLDHTSGRRQRWFRERDLIKARRLELQALREYDRVVVCSDEDAASLRQLNNGQIDGRVGVVPNGVDLTAFRYTPVPAEHRVLFPGSLDYGPNVDGARWFCAEVWPAIRAAIPMATLVLAGRNPVPEILELGNSPGVSIHPNVPSMVAFFESARAVVVPLRVGTGTRLKALEAMASGRPVVGTSIGLGGIGVVDGLQARVGDGASTMASAVVEILQDDAVARMLGEAGRRHVEAHFGWDRIGAEFVALVSELIQDSAVRRTSRVGGSAGRLVRPKPRSSPR